MWGTPQSLVRPGSVGEKRVKQGFYVDLFDGYKFDQLLCDFRDINV